MKKIYSIFFLVYSFYAFSDTYSGGTFDLMFNSLLEATNDTTKSSYESDNFSNTLGLKIHYSIDTYYNQTSINTKFFMDFDINKSEIFKLDQNDIGIRTFEFKYFLSDNIEFSIGYLNSYYGNCLLIRPIQYLNSNDIFNFLQGKFDYLINNEVILTLLLAGNQSAFTLQYSPLPVYSNFIESTSLWFPSYFFPNVLWMPLIGEKYLGTVTFIPTENVITAESSNFLVTYQYNSVFTDFTIAVFYGLDHNSILQPEIKNFQSSTTTTFDIELSQVEDKILSFGTSISVFLDPFVLWLETTYTPDKTILLDWYSAEGKLFSLSGKQETGETPVINYSLGSSLEINKLNTRLFFEYSNIHIFPDLEHEIIIPAFSHLLGIILDSNFFDYTLGFNLTTLMSFSDFSGLVFPSIHYTIWDSDLSFSIPFFFGKENSEFGQFKNNYSFTLKSTVHF